MPNFEFTSPEGKMYTVQGPDGATKEQAFQILQGQLSSQPEQTTMQKVLGGIRDAGAGLVRGAGSIGATIVAPYDIAKDAIAGRGLLDSNKQRRADMDSALTDLTGSDPNSTAYGAGKLVSEVAGTLGTGGAAANVLTRVAPRAVEAAPALVEAIRTGGMSTGARAASGFIPQAANLGTRVAGGAINGGLSAALIDPRDTGMGVAVGGAVPVVAKVAGLAGQAIGSAVSPRMARNAATNKIAGALGDDVPQTIADIQTYLPKGAEDIPVSTAAATKNPRLAQLEQGSRINASPAWYDFDQQQGKAVYDNVLKATQEAGDLGDRYAQRQDNWREAWQSASENMKPRLWQKRMTQFGADLETASRSPDSSNPQIRAVLDAINSDMDRVGPSFSPGNLQQLRANLSGKVQPMSPDVFKSAPRDSPAIKSLIAEMDDILNVSTGGKWQKVIQGYAQDSDSVHAAKAAARVRGAFVDDATGRVRGVALDPNGDVPKITEAGLNGAMDAARMPDKSLALSADANNRLTATLDALRAQNIVQKLKRTSTAGGGSDTIPNAIAAGMAQGVGAPNLLMQVLGAVRKIGTAKTDNALAQLLTNPDELASVLEQFQRPQAPNRLATTLYRAAPAIAADR